jgi:ribosome recycling factor
MGNEAFGKIEKDLNSNLSKAYDKVKDDLSSIRAGRANPQLFQKVMVDYYGTKTPLMQLATINLPEARVVIISPYDKSFLDDIIRGINEADLGVNPQKESTSIRVVLPEMTQERREEYIKLAKTKAEEARVNARKIRQKAREEAEELKKAISEDELRRFLGEVDKIVKTGISKIDDALKTKEEELKKI